MAGIVRLFSFLLRSDQGRSSRTIVALVILAGIASGLCSTGLVALINRLLSSTGPRPVWLLAAFAALCVLLPVLRYTSNDLLIRLTERAQLEMRLSLCRRMLAAPLRQLEELGSHRLLAALTGDVGDVVAALTTVPALLTQSTIVLGCLVYLGWLSLTLLLLVLGFMAIGIAVYQIAVRRAQRFFKLRRESWEALFRHFRGLTEGIKELKLHDLRSRAFFSELLERASEERMRYSIKANSFQVAAGSWSQFVFFILLGLLLFGATGVEVNTKVLIGYTLAILYILTPLEVIFNIFPHLARANVALEALERLGLSLAAMPGEPSAESLMDRAEWRHLEMVDVTHVYRRESDETFILGPVNLSLRRGELVFIVGGNGSGKTTLAKLLVGLYTPESGEIRVDGEPLTAEALTIYRQLFTVVFSDFFLFDSLLGLEHPELDARAAEYLAALQLSHKVQVKDGALSTLSLSQGQRKRLALLTAYMEDRSIYLFDEWAADQDPLFKEFFYRRLLPDLHARGKTIVVISHDDRYYDAAGRIIKLRDGRIESDTTAGKHAESAAGSALQVQ